MKHLGAIGFVAVMVALAGFTPGCGSAPNSELGGTDGCHYRGNDQAHGHAEHGRGKSRHVATEGPRFSGHRHRRRRATHSES